MVKCRMLIEVVFEDDKPTVDLHFDVELPAVPTHRSWFDDGSDGELLRVEGIMYVAHTDFVLIQLGDFEEHPEMTVDNWLGEGWRVMEMGGDWSAPFCASKRMAEAVGRRC